jgi:hypothetical protein
VNFDKPQPESAHKPHSIISIRSRRTRIPTVLILAAQEVEMLRKIEIQIWATKYFLRPYLEKAHHIEELQRYSGCQSKREILNSNPRAAIKTKNDHGYYTTGSSFL